MRIPFVAGNWKMNLLADSARALAEKVRQKLDGIRGVEVALCPPFVFLRDVAEAVRGSQINVGGQNLYTKETGAFTGEVSGPMLRSVGCTYVIIGHSERRHILGETDDFINEKVKAALKAGLKPILCVGELLGERDAGKTEGVVQRQVEQGLAGLSSTDLAAITIAYEPVWAIGTGRNATPQQAQEVHALIRGLINQRFGAAQADALRIQYGGSVKPDNAKALMSQPDVDGALVGGASLDADSFCVIVCAALRGL
jgi:triosephosphate isomerase